MTLSWRLMNYLHLDYFSASRRIFRCSNHLVITCLYHSWRWSKTINLNMIWCCTIHSTAQTHYQTQRVHSYNKTTQCQQNTILWHDANKIQSCDMLPIIFNHMICCQQYTITSIIYKWFQLLHLFLFVALPSRDLVASQIHSIPHCRSQNYMMMIS